LERATAADRRLFDFAHVEDVFTCVEYAFDAVKLKVLARARLEAAGAELALGTKVRRVEADVRGLRVEYAAAAGTAWVTAGEVLNCTYSQINELLENSHLPLIRLKHELTEMALVEPPEELREVGVTVMCGPFFSCMPFPARGLHTLSHVRYTPHAAWQDGTGPYASAHDWFASAPKVSRFPHMIRASAQYLPALRRAQWRDSLWEVKTVLPQSEGDDSRPILFRRDHGLPGMTCIMGGKIDNIYDALQEYDQEFATR
jgi:glycine/D-amino acid oxidase-like deaminating enzyme